jgi:membrane protease YdiL (CAAX protease family)
MVAMLVVVVTILSLQSAVKSLFPGDATTLGMAFVCTLLAYAAYFAMVRLGEGRWPSELAIGPVLREYLNGFLAGCGIITLVVGSLWLTGQYDISRGNWLDWPHELRETIGTGLLEELLARLILFRLFARAFGLPAGFLVSAAAFGAAHLANQNASPLAAIAIEAGLLFASFYFLTGRVWMSAGIHAGWNLSLGGIFGARVSGMTGEGSFLFSLPSHGSSGLITGGAFGPEASIPAIIVGLASFIVTMSIAPNARPDTLSSRYRNADPVL